ncbi:high mobility group protein B1-like [Crassostrea angulata]|uniref:high mobility group protein B1-like n=1 Tax=Magallana angulata TaxID=2784310 RepID=UPI0022B0FD5D|nr:high mobility group protein B1-like [Crassostrea angulata]
MTETLEAQLETLTNENAFLQKYFSLRKKCEQLQQANEKIVNRIQHVKKLIKRYKRERRFLTSRLDEHGDDYKDAQIPVMWEEDQIHNPLRAMKSSNGKAHGVKHSSDIISAVSPRVLADMGQISSSKSKKKVEKAKDFVGPKKPANAFLLFCQHRRTAVSEEYFKEKHEEISNHELTRRIALEWNILKPDQKKIYFDLYEQEKEQYEREMKIYHEQELSRGMDREPNKGRESSEEVDAAAMEMEAQSAVNALMMDN